ncbi:phosphoglycerol transferase [Bifidobacterium bombi DSM 19703]|uniref:Phosphoglycerol transferase n=2 Tax=Bifidobacterium bombi TaxID=471511 RepID=A0A080N2J4_9BIFI|nr:phosphoglycerol transferase [Bifidobacterium bombi DSM 19703]
MIGVHEDDFTGKDEAMHSDDSGMRTTESTDQGKDDDLAEDSVGRDEGCGGQGRVSVPTKGLPHVAGWSMSIRWFGYVLLFLLFDFLCVLLLQQGVTQKSTRTDLSSPLDNAWTMICGIWRNGNLVLFLNMLLLGLIYLFVLMLTNRFWLSSGLLLVLCAIIAVAEHFKVGARYETILPSDLNFLKADAGSILSFIPSGSGGLIALAVLGMIFVVAILWIIARCDRRHGRVVLRMNALRGALVRLVCAVLSLLLVFGYTAQVSVVGSWANVLAHGMGDIPSMWDSVYDAQRNGPLVSFLGQVRPKIMDQPADYNEATMKTIARRYSAAAKSINARRDADMDDGSVLFILSESFSDPTRVPGLTVNADPMPQIRSIKDETTSGLMLSSGYGGGTANLEYMSLTGLSMANFDASLTSPYQQLVPGEKWTPTVNQLWGDKNNSIALHPYEPSMYSRAGNYKKFGFSHFYSLQPPEIIDHRAKLGSSPYVSDESAYASTYEQISKANGPKFFQLATMQNHMPYQNWYPDNDFKVGSSEHGAPLDSTESESIQTYASGVNHTDKATADFLRKLDELDKPVTVVFYGDHLPGIYKTASMDTGNSLALHETDYFIWSNKSSGHQSVKVPNSAYSSPNFFMAQVAEHMDARVSPYIAFLTQLHAKVSAMEPPVVNKIQGWDRIPAGQPIYLDAKGDPMNASDFDAKTKQLMHDYRLIQYDVTAGSGYLKSEGFMDVVR